MGKLIIFLGAGIVAIALSAPLAVLTTTDGDPVTGVGPADQQLIGQKPNIPKSLSDIDPKISNSGAALKMFEPPPEDEVDHDEDNIINISDLSITDHMDDQKLQAYIIRRYGFQIFKDCKQYNVTWKCMADCKKSGYFTVRMDKKCKCLCYHPMPTTSTTVTATTKASTTPSTSTNFWEGLNMPTFVGPIWATTRKPNALDTTSTSSTTKEPCVDVVTTTKANDALPNQQAPLNQQAPPNPDTAPNQQAPSNPDPAPNQQAPPNADPALNQQAPPNPDPAPNQQAPPDPDLAPNQQAPPNPDRAPNPPGP